MRLGLRSALPFALPTVRDVQYTALRILRWSAIAIAVIVTAGAVVMVSVVAVVLNLT